jgi:hypothetical protein
MLITNSRQACEVCNNIFIVTSNCCDSGVVTCPWCNEEYVVIKKNVKKQYNFMEIELRKSMDVDHGLSIDDDQIKDLMIYYASQYRDTDFEIFYKTLYPATMTSEALRCAYFIRLALGLNPDNRNIC